MAIVSSPELHADRVEILAKLVTFALGILYILGLLITNVQLMALGIADFSPLQSRYILVGFMFVFYVGLGCAILFLIAFFCFMSVSEVEKKGKKTYFHPGWLVVGLIVVPIVTFFAIFVIGRLYPWGLQSTNDRSMESSVQFALWWSQFSETYFRWEIAKIAAFIIISFFTILIIGSKKNEWLKPAHYVVGVLFVGFILPYLLVFYAEEIYPNFKYNLGGGQPQVAKISLSGKGAEIGNTRQALSCQNAQASPPQSIPAIHSDETISECKLAIWYQSDKFIYVTTIPDRPSIKVIAVDIKLVRYVENLTEAYEVFSGSHIRRHTF